MDRDIEELKRMVTENLALTEETNRMVRKLRRASWWSTFFTLLYWALIIGAIAASYLYVSPYVSKFMQFYRAFEPRMDTQTASSTQSSFVQEFQNFFSGSHQ